MIRDLKSMADTGYDVLVIGGGITGAFVAWDASLRGLRVALIDKGDFGAATSAATSKLIHGGLRYLKTLEVGLVRESLQERRIMEIIAPHLVYPMPFIFPAYGWGMRGLPAAISAMVFYDTLSYDRKWINDDDKKIPGHEKYSAERILELEPVLDAKDLKGGVIYYDCMMYNSERLTLEPILSAAEYGADVANYVVAEDLIRAGERIEGARVRDLLNEKEYTIRATVTVNAAGPWADLMLGKIRGKKHHGLIRSKGIHIITRSLHKDHAIVLQTASGRHFFILPWRGHSLIGTTDVVYKGNPDEFKVTETDIAEFLAEINATVPSASLTRDDVLFQYGGLRPIVEKETSVEIEVYDASRKYELYDHALDEGIHGFVTAIGGKYTTSRNMARQLVDILCEKLGRAPGACQTHTTPLIGGEIGRYASFTQRAKRAKPFGLSDAVIENLCRNYGACYPKVLESAQKKKHFERICDEFDDIVAQILYAVHSEMAVRLSDVLFRRTGLCTLGNPGEEVIEKVADIMAGELKWKSAQKNAEMDKALENFITLNE
ncbi:MAG TPA: glycerol-3-phosphate dehydrogenase/oxidase [Deltaproteobacteria bacterium]|nr:glycerol-3-phosphate dehydrogenase/oxidase [Deltaproteobacteria bacterium]